MASVIMWDSQIDNKKLRIQHFVAKLFYEYTPFCNNDVTIPFICSQYPNAKTFSQPVEICPS